MVAIRYRRISGMWGSETVTTLSSDDPFLLFSLQSGLEHSVSAACVSATMTKERLCHYRTKGR